MRSTLNVGDVMGRRRRDQTEGLLERSSKTPKVGLGKPVKDAIKSSSK